MRAAFLGAALAAALTAASLAQAPRSAPPSLTPPRGVATFAAGTFWYLEADFDALEGVLRTVSGYAGGASTDPGFEQVASGKTGHAFAVQVTFDPVRLSYSQLLDHFWRLHDPLTPNGQFCEKGSQYRAAIFAHDEEQKTVAEESKAAYDAARRFDRPIVTEVVPLDAFYGAGDDQQDYYLRHPVKYRYFRWDCGRDKRLKELWGEEAGPK
jgi:peptide-methionine (S)-S-oxide reductase